MGTISFIPEHQFHGGTLSQQLALSTPEDQIMDLQNNTRMTDTFSEIYMRDTLTQCFPPVWDKGRPVGSGTFGDVFLVVDTAKPSEEIFVVKEIRISILKKDKIMNDFKKETDILLLLGDHHRIVPFYGYTVTDTLASIFMGFMRMGSLANFSKNNELSEEVCFQFTNQILEGLAYLHDQGVIHRDIKGTNILLENETSIRLTDFGISKIVNETTKDFTMERGNFRWMAPEVCNEERNEKRYSFEADIWSLGCTVIEMITKNYPYNSIQNICQVILKVGSGVPPQFPKNISEQMKQLLQATFVKSPTERMSAKKLIQNFFHNAISDKHESVNEPISEPIRSDNSETQIQLHNIDCTKNPNHAGFIPVHAFSLHHLPATSQDQNIYILIKTVAELTVKIDVKMTSSDRPQFWPDSSVNYPYHNIQNKSEARTGSGLVYSVSIHTENECSKCTCQKCLLAEDPSKVWGIVEIMTATHVVFDDLEANNTSCRLFYDDLESNEFILDNFSIVVADKVKNWTLLKCTTCNKDILDRVNIKLGCFENRRSEKYLNADSEKLGFIVSHPHGGSKQISIGKLLDTKILDKNWSQLTYTICTCPGSSGAYVHIVQNNCLIWHYPHVHTGALNNEVNYSSVGYCASNQVFKRVVMCKYVDMKSETIPKDWEKGTVICSGKFSKMYTLVDPNNPSETIFMIKEKVLPKNKETNNEKLLRDYKNELQYSELTVLIGHERIVPYYGFIMKTDCILKFLGYMPMGSLSSYYRRNGPIYEERCLLYTKQILEGLQYLHKKQVLHMNIRGKNILLQSETHIKLSGFEYSVSNVDTAQYPRNIRWTSPQLINPDHYRRFDKYYLDVWSLGCTIVEMLTANVPYGYYKTITSVVMEIGNFKPPKIYKPVSRAIQEILDMIFDNSYRKLTNTLLEKMSWIEYEHTIIPEKMLPDFMTEHYSVLDVMNECINDVSTKVYFYNLSPLLDGIFSSEILDGAGERNSDSVLRLICRMVKDLSKDKFFKFVDAVGIEYEDIAENIRQKYKHLGLHILMEERFTNKMFKVMEHNVKYRVLRPHLIKHNVFHWSTLLFAEDGEKASFKMMQEICDNAKYLSKDKFVKFVDAISVEYPDVADQIRTKYKEVSGKELPMERGNTLERSVAGLEEYKQPLDSTETHLDSFVVLDDTSSDMKSETIPKDWEKGTVIYSGKFSKMYTLVDPNNPSETKFMIKEKVLSKNKENISEKLLRDYNNEYQSSKLTALRDQERIVPYYGFVMKTDCISKFLGYMPMGSLSSYYRRNGAIKEESCLFYTKQILEGLEYLHGRQIRHMNIRGKNIFLQSESHIKISGFEYSLSKIDSEQYPDIPQSFNPVKNILLQSETHLNLIGNEYSVSNVDPTQYPRNIRWTSPQLINPHYFRIYDTHYYDVWSLGCTIVEMLTANVPYGYLKTITAVVMEIGNAKPPKLNKTISRAIQEILDMIFDISDRKSANTLLEKMSWIEYEHTINPEQMSTDFITEHYYIIEVMSKYSKDVSTKVNVYNLSPLLIGIFSGETLDSAIDRNSNSVNINVSAMAKQLTGDKLVKFIEAVGAEYPETAKRIMQGYKTTTINITGFKYRLLRPHLIKLDVFDWSTLLFAEKDSSNQIMQEIFDNAKYLSKDKFVKLVDAISVENPDVADQIRTKYKEVSGKELPTERENTLERSVSGLERYKKPKTMTQ